VEWMGGSNKALAILRVSSHRQKDNTSHDVQEREITAYCKANGLNLMEVISIVESAKDSDDRRKYLAALDVALKKKAKHILFYMFDRESRNLTDNEKNEKSVRSGQIVIHYVHDRKIYHKYSPDSDFFMRDIQAVTNKQFIRNLSAKVNDAMRAKAESGWFPNNHAPLGYIHQHLTDENGRARKRGTTIVPDTNTQAVRQVMREFELRAKGYSYQEVRDIVVEEGFIPKNRQSQYRAGTVDKRIKNPFYYGRFRWQGQEYDGKHELIIPKAILEKVQETYGKRYSRRTETSQGVFSGGWLKCGDPQCGCAISYDPKVKILKNKDTKVFHYYHCTNGKRVHSTMKGMSTTEDKVWGKLETAVDAITITKTLADELADALNKAHEKANATVRKQIAVYSQKLKELEGREDVLYEDLKKGVLDDFGYRRQVQRVRDDRADYTKILEELQCSLNDAFRETAKSILELATTAKSLWLSRSPKERRDFLDKILSNPTLNGANIEFDLRKPFATIAEMASNQSWRPLRDSNSCLLRERELSWASRRRGRSAFLKIKT
jgi:site-specific DNA recombinase